MNNESISPIHEAFYLESIIYAAERAMAAFKRFDQAYIQSETDNNSLVVANIQEALTHVGELSRNFWPSRSIYSGRGEKLRKAFGLEDNSPLKNRELRDTLEHFDERLDMYLKDFPVGRFVTSPIIGDISSSKTSGMHVFRAVNPRNSTFIILDETYEFGQLRDATEKVLSKAREIYENGGRLE